MKKSLFSSVLLLAGGFFGSPLFKKKGLWVLFRVIHAFLRLKKFSSAKKKPVS
jgi:hypothetical protein